MKKIFAIYFILQFVLYAQVAYVPVDDEIYTFLDRMNTLNIIENYNSFEIPKTRKEVKKYLINILDKVEKLDFVDQNKFSDFLAEFEVDLISTQSVSDNLYPDFDFQYLINEKEKYLYSFNDKTGSSFFLNFIGNLDYLHNSNYENTINSNSTLYRFGGELRGTLYNKIGFYVNTTNGSFFGSKNLARNYSSLKYNYKFTKTNSSPIGDNFFDETSAYLIYENEYAKFKIGNDRKLVGHGNHKVLLSDNPPRMEYVSLDLKYKIFEFSFFHGKLLGNQFLEADSIQGSINNVDDKYLAYHRFGLNLSKHLNIGLGEMIVYGNRNIDFSYLNPFNFYKSAEHANQDRDNTFLFFDLQNNSIDGLKFYSTILFDDIDFGKIGSGWYGNQSLISAGLYSSLLYNYIPLDFEIQYVKIDPYVFTHRIHNNNYTNSYYNLGSNLQPNSSSINFWLYYRPHYRVNIETGFKITQHGANLLDYGGNVIVNYGGDILVGHRPNDSEIVYFLTGKRETLREFIFNIKIEPIKNWILSLNFNYSNNSLARSQYTKDLFTTFSLYLKI